MTQSIPPLDLSEDEAEKMQRLTQAVMSGLYDEARAHYANLLLTIWAFGARRDQLLSDIRPVEEIGFSETALDSLLNDGTFVIVNFEAPHPYHEGELQRRELIFHRDNVEKVDVHVNPEKYRQRWNEFQQPRVEADLRCTISGCGHSRSHFNHTDGAAPNFHEFMPNPQMLSPNYPWNRREHVEESISV